MPTTAADAYPEARFERNPPSSATPAVPPARSATPPRSRFFNVEWGSQANSRSTVSTPRIIGPAIIQQVIVKNRTASDPPQFSWELGWALAPITEGQVALTAPKGWNAINERLRHAYETPLPNAIGSVQVNKVGAQAFYLEGFTAPFLITAPEFYLTLTFHNFSAATNPFAAWAEIYVLENIAPEVAANFH